MKKKHKISIKKLIDFNWKDYNKLPIELTTVVGDYINIINMTFI